MACSPAHPSSGLGIRLSPPSSRWRVVWLQLVEVVRPYMKLVLNMALAAAGSVAVRAISASAAIT